MQIESFALVLAQILHIRGLSTPLATAPDVATADPSSESQCSSGAAPASCGHLKLAADGTVVAAEGRPKGTLRESVLEEASTAQCIYSEGSSQEQGMCSSEEPEARHVESAGAGDSGPAQQPEARINAPRCAVFACSTVGIPGAPLT